MTDMFTPDGALDAFKSTFDPTDEDGGLPMLLVRDQDDHIVIMALAMDMPMQQMLPIVLASVPTPKSLTLTAESWKLDPVTRERTGECVMITGATAGGDAWGRFVDFTRDAQAGTVEWGEIVDIPAGQLSGGVPEILQAAVR